MLNRCLRIQLSVCNNFSQLSIRNLEKLQCFSSSDILLKYQRHSWDNFGFEVHQQQRLYASFDEPTDKKFQSLHKMSYSPASKSKFLLDIGALTVYVNRKRLAEILRMCFDLTDKEVAKIINSSFKFWRVLQQHLKHTIDLIISHDISKESLVENPWIFSIEPKILEEKLAHLADIGVRDINDVVPLLQISSFHFVQIVSQMGREKNLIASGNRIYYLSDMLGNVEPRIVSKMIVNHIFMVEMPFELLSNNLSLMIELGVPPTQILRNAKVLRRDTDSIRSLLKRAQADENKKLMPRMVSCPESRLEKLRQNNSYKKAIPGLNPSTIDYVSKRLQFDLKTTKAIMAKYSPAARVCLTKIKDVLDYLLDEAEFDRHEIAKAPKIFCQRLETTKTRIEELKSHDCQPISLASVCRSSREYNKFVTRWLQRKSTAGKFSR